jgi:transposase
LWTSLEADTWGQPIYSFVGAAGRCARCAELELQVALMTEQLRDLRQQVRALVARVRELETEGEKTSRNSSRPPSSDPPGMRPPRKPSGRAPGAQPGHEGKSRQPFTAAQVDRREDLHPKRCHRCGADVRGLRDGAVAPVRHQVVEVPKVSAFVTEYALHGVACPCCGEVTRAEPPVELGGAAVGPRLQAVLSMLTGRYRLSRREAAEVAVAVFGEKAQVCVGTVCAMEARTADALGPAYDQAARGVQGAAAVHADETSFSRGGPPAWLWTACSADVSYFRLDDQRSRQAFRSLLPDFGGVLVTDRFSVYHEQPARRHQFCWSHLQRNFQALADRGGAAARLGRAGVQAAGEVFAAWKDHRQGGLSLPGVARRLAPTRQALRRALKKAARCRDAKAAAVGRNLLTHFPSLWTFTRHPDVPPDNNLAEREIRPAVLWRKGSFGVRSASGRRFVARMLTAARTLRRQGRNLLDFLDASIRAHNAGRPAPNLLTA